MNQLKINKKGVPGLFVRLGALYILRAVLERRVPLDDVLREMAESKFKQSLSIRDRGHTRAITVAVLRHLGQINAVLTVLLRKPLPKRAKGVEFILRIGVAELLFLDAEPHAVVNTANEAVKRERGLAPYSGLVNASLRRIVRERDFFQNELKNFTVNIPEWLASRWKLNYGDATFGLISEAVSNEPPLDLTAVSEPKKLATKLDGQIMPTGSIRLKSANRIEELPEFHEGTWWVQDAAASIPVTLLGNLEGQEVLDVCAAPGGKTMQLASSGARVTAIDRSRKRMSKLESNLKRVKCSAELVTTDFLKWEQSKRWKHILLDAPCTATGTSRRHPDILHLKTKGELNKLALLQFKLLKKAVNLLENGGTLVYCTCSLEPEEGVDQLTNILAENQNLVHVPIESSEIEGQDQFLTPTGNLQTLPCHWHDSGGIDGFFAFRIRKL